MNRIADYEELKKRIVKWLSDYVVDHNIKSFVVGVSGGIDSAVVSTLCAETGLKTYVLSMPLNQISVRIICSSREGGQTLVGGGRWPSLCPVEVVSQCRPEMPRALQGYGLHPNTHLSSNPPICGIGIREVVVGSPRPG